MLAPAQFDRLVKTPKRISKNEISDTFFKTRDKIPHLLESLVVGMPKRVFEVNCKKMKFTLHINPCVLEKIGISNYHARFPYVGLITLSGRNYDFLS